MSEKEELLLKMDGNSEYPQIRFLKDGTHEIWLDKDNKVDIVSPLSGHFIHGTMITQMVNDHFL